MNSVGYLNEFAIVPTQTSLQEFKVQTSNLSAQFGRSAGGIVSFVTKSGTNHFHGEAYELIRNKVLNANNFFNNRSGIANPQFTQNQFGGNLGGPIIKNKLFFFGSYDGFRMRQGLPFLLTVPTAAERAGDFSNLHDSSGQIIPIYDPTTTKEVNGVFTRTQFPNNKIPAADLDPTALALERFWPLPNVTGTPSGANNWAGNESTGGNMDEYIGRGDYDMSNRQRMFVRYTFEKWNRLPDNAFGTGVNISPDAAGQGPNSNVIQQAALDDTVVFSPNVVGDFAFGFLRASLVVKPLLSGFDLSTLGPGWGSIAPNLNELAPPAINMSQVTGWSTATALAIQQTSDDYTFLPNFTWTIGRNTLQLGAEYQFSDLDFLQANNADGSFNFSPSFTNSGPSTAVGGDDVASFVLGDADAGSVVTVNKPLASKYYYAFYAQDKWRMTNSLTIDMGLRYSYDSPFVERRNRISTFLPDAVNTDASESGLDIKGAMALVDTQARPGRTGVNGFHGALAPRFGFGYQVNGKTVLRGGYGIFWTPIILSFNAAMPVQDPVNAFTTVMVNSLDGGLTPHDHLSDPFPDGVALPPGRSGDINALLNGQSPSVQYPNNPVPYMQQWNLDIERKLPWGIMADAAYAASKGTHFPMGVQIDQLSVADMSKGAALLNSVPNPFYGLSTPFTGTLAGPTIPEGQLLRPYPQYDGLFLDSNFGATAYQSFQLKLQRDFSSGDTVLLAYTKSKTLTNGAGSQTGWLQGPAGIQNYDNLSGEWGLATYDVPQRMVVSYVLDLPFGKGREFFAGAHGIESALVSGWGSSAIWTWQRGFPLAFGTATNLTGSLGGGSRPNYDDVGACGRGAGESGSTYERVAKWFNTACFTQPAPFTFGDVSRTSGQLRSGGTDTIDFAMSKVIPMPGEHETLRFRAQAFNLFNTPVFAGPNTTLGSPGFGTVTSQSNNPRLIQFGLNLSF